MVQQLQNANETIFGHPEFRNQQLDIMKAVMRNEDVFVVMPTGGGKSLCYGLPAVLSPGVTVVISPLLSLIEDQVSALLSLPCGGVPAAYLTSTCTDTQLRAINDDLRRARRGLQPYIKLLFVTPEKMVKALDTRELLKDLYDNEMLARFVIDECHCVSSWGHDFRPDYGKLGLLKEQFPQCPILALTATARKKVAEDTKKVLRISHAHMFHSGFDRPNLFFQVVNKPSRMFDTQVTEQRPHILGTRLPLGLSLTHTPRPGPYPQLRAVAPAGHHRHHLLHDEEGVRGDGRVPHRPRREGGFLPRGPDQDGPQDGAGGVAAGRGAGRHTHTHTCTHVRTYTYTHIRIHIHTYIHTYIHTHAYTRTYTRAREPGCIAQHQTCPPAKPAFCVFIFTS